MEEERRGVVEAVQAGKREVAARGKQTTTKAALTTQLHRQPSQSSSHTHTMSV